METRRQTMSLFLGLSSLFLVFSTAAVVPTTKESKLASATNDLAFDLIRANRDDSNVLISPFSVSTALALVYLGASGRTAQVLRHVLKYDEYKLTAQEVHDAFRSTLNQVKRTKDGYQLSTVNAMFVEKNFTVLDIFYDALEYYHSVKVEKVDFATQGALVRNKINDMIARETKGKIKEFLDEPPNPDTKLFLMNVLYFLGNWNKPFDTASTYEDTFYNRGVSEKKVQMMGRSGTYDYSISNELQSTVVVLPYKGDRSASMIVVLPHERTGIFQLEQKLNKQSLNRALNDAAPGRVNLRLPKFHLEYSANMRDSLSRMGLGELFGDEANLSRIVGNKNGLRVSSFAHKVVIDVNERGSEAAAATSAEFAAKSLAPVISVSHPFLIFVREDSTGIILFSGRVMDL